MSKTNVNPLAKILEDRLPGCDIGVLEHGFLDHGRDYFFVVQDAIGNQPGTYRLTFTHVVELNYLTTVRDEVWPSSWTDEFTNNQTWLDAGEPEGSV